MSEEKERVPCHESIKVIEQKTIYKTPKWWQAVVYGEIKGRHFVALYLWQKRNDTWKQKHKANFNRKQDWEKVKPVVEKMVQNLP